MTRLPVIDRSQCMGCGACAGVCPSDALSLHDGFPVCEASNCTGCGQCVKDCPVNAISMPGGVEDAAPKTPSPAPLSSGEVWVFAEQTAGVLAGVSFELLGEGRKLADALGVPLAAILLGSETDSMVRSLGERGADRVYVADRPELAIFQDERYARLISEAIEHHKPQIMLCGATVIGRSLASRIAVTIRTGLTADCTALSIDPESHHLLQTRPAFGGNILATIETPDFRPQMATVRPKVMREAPVTPGHQADVVSLLPENTPEDLVAALLRARTERIGFTATEADGGASLAVADVIVSGGRGMQKPENFALLHELAALLGGSVGASRAAVDAGWIPYAHQIGQTGRTVCPKLYFACGISGQIQHLAGMSSSDIIVAINRDPAAPIFQHATYGLVGDAMEILPALIRAFRKRLGK